MKRRNLFKMLAGLVRLPAAAAVAEMVPKPSTQLSLDSLDAALQDWTAKVTAGKVLLRPSVLLCHPRDLELARHLAGIHTIDPLTQRCSRCGVTCSEVADYA